MPVERLPDLDQVLEVQVLEAGDSPPAAQLVSVAGSDARLRFAGERPDGLDTLATAGFGDAVADVLGEVLRGDVEPSGHPVAGKRYAEIPVTRTGPLAIVLGYAAGTWPACRVLLPRVDLGARSPGGYRFDLERVTLAERYEPGAEVVVARVWRGGTAIPSRESVALTTVAADGRLSFVRQAGEAGDTLRLLLRPRDGEARWIDVDTRGPRLVINLQKDGRAHVTSYEYALLKQGDAAGSAPEPDLEAFEALRGQLALLARDRGARDAGGASDVAVLIHAEAGTSWRVVQWVLQTCAHPDVALARVRFAVMDAPAGVVRNDLPRDEGLVPHAAEDVQKLRVRLVRRDDVTRFDLRGGGAVVVEGAVAGAGSALAALREGVRQRLAQVGDARVQVEILVPPGPDAERVPYGDVHAVLQALHEAGAGQVLFEGAPLPR